jgi:hypothetical protein
MEIAFAYDRALVRVGEWQLACDLHFEGTDAVLVDYQDYH